MISTEEVWRSEESRPEAIMNEDDLSAFVFDLHLSRMAWQRAYAPGCLHASWRSGADQWSRPLSLTTCHAHQRHRLNMLTSQLQLSSRSPWQNPPRSFSDTMALSLSAMVSHPTRHQPPLRSHASSHDAHQYSGLTSTPHHDLSSVHAVQTRW